MTKKEALQLLEVRYVPTNVWCRVIGVCPANANNILIHHFGVMSVSPLDCSL